MELSKAEFTKNALDLYFSEMKEVGQTLLKANPNMLCLKTLASNYKTKRLKMTLHFKGEVRAYRKGYVKKLKGYFKNLGTFGNIYHCRAKNAGGRNIFSSSYSNISFDNIEKIQIHFPITKKEAAKRLLKKIHPNLWNELKVELKAYIAGTGKEPSIIINNGSNLRYKHITSIFNRYEITWQRPRLKEVIETGGTFSWSESGSGTNGRDRSISVNDCRAWFSSEYIDCGNGDYWLLINPTTAVFCEKD